MHTPPIKVLLLTLSLCLLLFVCCLFVVMCVLVRVPLPDARAALVSSLSADAADFTVSNQWIEGYVQETGLTVKLNVDTEAVLATREVDGWKVRIGFRANDYADPSMQNEENEEEAEQEESITEQNFSVDVTAPNGKILHLDASNAQDGELIIYSLTFPSSVSADPTTTPAPKLGDDMPDSTALDFNDLPEASQNNLLDLLENINVDDDLALFVANQAQLVRTLKLQKEMNSLKQWAQ